METQELLRTLGIDISLPVEMLLEQLEDKNLEYLERLDACTDENRAAELRSVQEQIEAAISALQSGIALQKEKAPARPKKNPAKAAPTSEKPPAALKATPPPAPKVPVQPVAPRQKTQRELFDAAQAGDGAAALELTGMYFADGNYESAWKWAKTAHSLKTPGAGQHLIDLYGKAGNKDELLALCAEEIGWLTGYDQFTLCESLYAFLHREKFSHQQIRKTAGDILALLSDDSPARDMMEEAYQTAEKAIAAQQQQAEQRKKDQEAKEQARKAALERAEKQRKEQQHKEAQEKAKQSRQHFWQKIFPVIFCIFAPPLWAWGVNSLFWLLFRKGSILTPRGMNPLIFTSLLPLLAGILCYLVPCKLRHGPKGNGFRRALKFSAVWNVIFYYILAFIADILGGFLSNALPITLLGPLKLTAENYYAYGTTVAFYICSIVGLKNHDSLLDIFFLFY